MLSVREINLMYLQGQNSTMITTNNMGLITIDDDLIYYQHYGSSAVPNSFEKFYWIMETIFKNYNADDFRIIRE